MKVSVIGTGYVGLVTGTCLAEKGNEVICVDIDPNKVDSLSRGQVPIYEPGLDQMVSQNHARGRLTFTTDYEQIEGSQAIFLALPTPESEDGSADLRYVRAAAAKIGSIISSYTVVVTKSTVPPGTAGEVRNELLKYADPELFDVASNPEFLKEGDAIHDFQHPDRIVLGVDSDQAWATLRELYLPFVPNNEGKLIRTGVTEAEIIKYASNTMLAARVALTNEIAGICERAGADSRVVMQAVGQDRRIGPAFLNPGPGYGGSCFPKDVVALAHTAQKLGANSALIESINTSNEIQKHVLPEIVREELGEDLDGKRIAVWGLAFKPNTDDIRETPARVVIDSLLSSGAQVMCYDPEALANMARLYQDVPRACFLDDQYGVLDGADALVIVTDWDVFKTPNWAQMSRRMTGKVIIDGRALYVPDYVRGKGYIYRSIGRGQQ